MFGAWRAITVSAVVVASFAIGPVRADSFGGSQGFKAGGGFQGFNPGGFQGFNPGGFQGFNPKGGFQGFNPGEAGPRPGLPKHGPFLRDRRFSPSFAKGGYWAGSYGVPVYYGSALDDSPLDYPSAYAPPPVYASPIYVPVVIGPVASGAVPAAPARPSVIEFPEGRYELRGDGVGSLYTWVWIPNPPAAPPASASLPTAPGLGSDERSPVRKSQLYRWVDEQGVMHLTDNAATVPEQFRKQAKRDSL